MGYAYADSFMARGHSVVICDVRDPEAAVAALQQKHAGGTGKVYGETPSHAHVARVGSPHIVLPSC